MDAVMAAMKKPEAAAAMEHAVVLPETLVISVRRVVRPEASCWMQWADPYES